MFQVRRNQKTPNMVEFYHKEYKDNKEPEITLDENTGNLIIYKTFKRVLIEIDVMFYIISKKEKRLVAEEENKKFMSQLKAKCGHMADALRINEALMDYDWFESGYNRRDFL